MALWSCFSDEGTHSLRELQSYNSQCGILYVAQGGGRVNEPRLSTMLCDIDEDPAAATPVGRPGRKRHCRKLPHCGPLGGQCGQATTCAKVSLGRKGTARAEGPCNVASDLWASTFAFKSYYGNVT